MLKTLELIKKHQMRWAESEGIKIDKDGYVYCLKYNLFEPLCENAKQEYESAAGNELERKMKALHSSSALVCNFFHYWRSRRDIKHLTKALGISSGYREMVFEKKYRKPKEIEGVVPHVDIELSGEGLMPVAIESKFTETYTKSNKDKLSKAYIASDSIWGHMNGCRSLAKSITEGKKAFSYLDSPQLLKHILGLKECYDENNFILIYLWYDIESEKAKRHKEELNQFKDFVGSDLDFRAMTYQDLFNRIRVLPDEHKVYIEYLEKRYFPNYLNILTN